MARITPVKWQTLACIFEKAGFVYHRTEGDHRIYVHPEVLRPVVIPKYRSIGADIIHSNMRTAKMSRETYFRFLDEC